MNFLVDAQLPKRLANRLADAGHNVLHTLDLPLGNATPDTVINKISLEQNRIVITKDSDFVDSFVLNKVPRKLLLISTGNITNNMLLSLFEHNLTEIVQSLESNDFVELNQTSLVIHY